MGQEVGATNIGHSVTGGATGGASRKTKSGASISGAISGGKSVGQVIWGQLFRRIQMPPGLYMPGRLIAASACCSHFRAADCPVSFDVCGKDRWVSVRRTAWACQGRWTSTISEQLGDTRHGHDYRIIPSKWMKKRWATQWSRKTVILQSVLRRGASSHDGSDRDPQTRKPVNMFAFAKVGRPGGCQNWSDVL